MNNKDNILNSIVRKMTQEHNRKSVIQEILPVKRI